MAYHVGEWQRVLDLAHELPGVEIGTAYGIPALGVRGKLIARLWKGGQTVVTKTQSLNAPFFA